MLSPLSSCEPLVLVIDPWDSGGTTGSRKSQFSESSNLLKILTVLATMGGRWPVTWIFYFLGNEDVMWEFPTLFSQYRHLNSTFKLTNGFLNVCQDLYGIRLWDSGAYSLPQGCFGQLCLLLSLYPAVSCRGEVSLFTHQFPGNERRQCLCYWCHCLENFIWEHCHPQVPACCHISSRHCHINIRYKTDHCNVELIFCLQKYNYNIKNKKKKLVLHCKPYLIVWLWGWYRVCWNKQCTVLQMLLDAGGTNSVPGPGVKGTAWKREAPASVSGRDTSETGTRIWWALSKELWYVVCLDGKHLLIWPCCGRHLANTRPDLFFLCPKLHNKREMSAAAPQRTGTTKGQVTLAPPTDCSDRLWARENHGGPGCPLKVRWEF